MGSVSPKKGIDGGGEKIISWNGQCLKRRWMQDEMEFKN
jgi:hypothetical protein